MKRMLPALRLAAALLDSHAQENEPHRDFRYMTMKINTGSNPRGVDSVSYSRSGRRWSPMRSAEVAGLNALFARFVVKRVDL
jgi:hypothetical protein